MPRRNQQHMRGCRKLNQQDLEDRVVEGNQAEQQEEKIKNENLRELGNIKRS